jgi:hypothetical protein
MYNSLNKLKLINKYTLIKRCYTNSNIGENKMVNMNKYTH